MPRELTIVVPGLIKQGGQLQFNRKTGTAYRPKEHNERKKDVARKSEEQLEDIGLGSDFWPYFKKGTPLKLGVLFYFPYRELDYDKTETAEAEIELGYRDSLLKDNAPQFAIGQKDIDNMLKPLKDGMKNIVYNDDKEIVGYSDTWKLYSEVPETIITLTSLLLED